MLLRVRVQHKLRQRPMQPRHFAFHQAEPRARQFCRFLKIQAQRRAQVHMVFHGKIKGFGRAHFAHLHVFGFILAHGHALVRQVGDTQQQIIQGSLNARQILVELLLQGFHLRHFGFHRLGFIALALLHQFADLFGQRIHFRLRFFALHLQGFALVFQLLKRGGV